MKEDDWKWRKGEKKGGRFPFFFFSFSPLPILWVYVKKLPTPSLPLFLSFLLPPSRVCFNDRRVECSKPPETEPLERDHASDFPSFPFFREEGGTRGDAICGLGHHHHQCRPAIQSFPPFVVANVPSIFALSLAAATEEKKLST